MSSGPSEHGPEWLEHPAAPASPPRVARPADADARRRRRTTVAVAVAVAAALLGLLAALPRSGGGARTDSIDGSQVLRPITTAPDPSTGERTAPFDGFAVSVETQPRGALVVVGGVPRGEAPVLAGVECEPGAKVEILAEKAGLRPTRATTLCRRDTLVKLTVRLRR